MRGRPRPPACPPGSSPHPTVRSCPAICPACDGLTHGAPRFRRPATLAGAPAARSSQGRQTTHPPGLPGPLHPLPKGWLCDPPLPISVPSPHGQRALQDSAMGARGPPSLLSLVLPSLSASPGPLPEMGFWSASSPESSALRPSPSLPAGSPAEGRGPSATASDCGSTCWRAPPGP